MHFPSATGRGVGAAPRRRQTARPFFEVRVSWTLSERRTWRTRIEWPPSAHGTAHGATERGHPALQLLVDLFELVDTLKLIHGHREAAQNTDQQKGQPQLQPPANGFDEHDGL